MFLTITENPTSMAPVIANMTSTPINAANTLLTILITSIKDGVIATSFNPALEYDNPPDIPPLFSAFAQILPGPSPFFLRNPLRDPVDMR